MSVAKSSTAQLETLSKQLSKLQQLLLDKLKAVHRWRSEGTVEVPLTVSNGSGQRARPRNA